MQPFKSHTGRFITLDRANVDTDAIIPARYLKKVERTGFGEHLFADIRLKHGQPDPEFCLNKSGANEAIFLVARQNFGCGSSREHAVWAVFQSGLRAVIAPRVGSSPGFADIFRNNSYKNGLLPVEVSPEFANQLFDLELGTLTIDLEHSTITIHKDDGDVVENFAIPDGPRIMLLEGLDEIALSLKYETDIQQYESAHPDLAPVEHG